LCLIPHTSVPFLLKTKGKKMISTTANTTVAQWKGNCTPFPCRVIKSTSYPKQVVKCEASKNANENSVASAKFSAALFGFLSLPSLARAVELSDKPLQDLVNAVDLVGNSADNAAVDFGKYSASALGQTRALVDSAKPFVEQTGKTLQPLGKAALEFGTPLANDALRYTTKTISLCIDPSLGKLRIIEFRIIALFGFQNLI